MGRIQHGSDFLGDATRSKGDAIRSKGDAIRKRLCKNRARSKTKKCIERRKNWIGRGRIRSDPIGSRRLAIGSDRIRPIPIQFFFVRCIFLVYVLLEFCKIFFGNRILNNHTDTQSTHNTQQNTIGSGRVKSDPIGSDRIRSPSIRPILDPTHRDISGYSFAR